MLSVVDAPSGIVLEPKARLPFAAPSSNVNPIILSLLRHNRKAPPPGSPSPSPLLIFNWEPDHRTPRSAHAAMGMEPRARWLKAGHHHALGTRSCEGRHAVPARKEPSLRFSGTSPWSVLVQRSSTSSAAKMARCMLQLWGCRWLMRIMGGLRRTRDPDGICIQRDSRQLNPVNN